jgi:hypothetical protein
LILAAISRQRDPAYLVEQTIAVILTCPEDLARFSKAGNILFSAALNNFYQKSKMHIKNQKKFADCFIFVAGSSSWSYSNRHKEREKKSGRRSQRVLQRSRG